MLLRTILNRVQKFKSFVYGSATFVDHEKEPAIHIEMLPRKNVRAVCSGCFKRQLGYDREYKPRLFEFIPVLGFKVFFVYTMRRVECPQCGVRVESVPWSSGKQQLTNTYAWHLAKWAKRLSWKETAEAFHSTWHHVFKSVEMAVEWGRTHQSLTDVKSIGIDEIAWRKGHKYLTLVYQIDEGSKRLIWIGEHRKVKTLLRFFRWFGQEKAKS